LTRISGRRRDGLRTLLTRKTPPKGTAGFVAATLADHAEIVAQVGGNHLAADLLGCEAATCGRSAGIAALVGRPATPAPRSFTLALVLAGYEYATDVNSWRRVDPATRPAHRRRTGRRRRRSDSARPALATAGRRPHAGGVHTTADRRSRDRDVAPDRRSEPPQHGEET